MSSMKEPIIAWMRQQLQASGAQGFVFGMSGGIDSNTTALLAQAAGKHLGLILPIEDDPEDRQDAERVASQFNLQTQVIDLSQTYTQLCSLLPDSADAEMNALMHTNLKSRLRMSILYYYANLLQYLVIGTINRAEFTIGYFAKYGSYGDILPLTRLLKQDIRALAQAFGLPDDLVNKKASGCLTGNATAEQEWGITEESLDALIMRWNEKDEILSKDFPEVFEMRRLHRIAEHKRHYPPIFEPRQSES